jgi:hypothetical protein
MIALVRRVLIMPDLAARAGIDSVDVVGNSEIENPLTSSGVDLIDTDFASKAQPRVIDLMLVELICLSEL